MNWHVHQYPVSESLANIRAVGETGNAAGCDADVTGGHYDPTFACGSASQNNGNGICADLRATDQVPQATAKSNALTRVPRPTNHNAKSVTNRARWANLYQWATSSTRRASSSRNSLTTGWNLLRNWTADQWYCIAAMQQVTVVLVLHAQI